MRKMCKACGQSNFGVTLKKVEERAGRMVGGKIKEYFEGSEEIQEEISINYCFTCSREITEEDLLERYICKVCKSSVEQVNENGVCIKCAKEVNKLSEISREDLILMILKQNKEILAKPSVLIEPSKENEIAIENKKVKNKEKLVKNDKKDVTIKREYKTVKSLDSSKVEIDSEKKVSSKRKVQCKSNNKINNAEKESKKVTILSRENMDKAISNNKEKTKSTPKIKSVDNKSLNYVTDKNSSHIEDIKDMFMLKDIKEDIDIKNINIEIVDGDVVHNTLMEIEDVMNNMSSFN